MYDIVCFNLLLIILLLFIIMDNVFKEHEKNDEKLFSYFGETMKSAWANHFWFVVPLVRLIKPQIIVELGTDRGYSLLSFFIATKGIKCKIYGIDSYGSILGKKDPGMKSQTNKDSLKSRLKPLLETKDKLIKDYDLSDDNIEIIVDLFSNASKRFENKKIDILHIDGNHNYNSVKDDYNNFIKYVNLDQGIILFHDVCRIKHKGVFQFFNEINENKYWIYPQSGLGIVTNNKKYIEYINLICYNSKSKYQKYIGKAKFLNLDKRNITNLNKGNIPSDILY